MHVFVCGYVCVFSKYEQQEDLLQALSPLHFRQ